MTKDVTILARVPAALDAGLEKLAVEHEEIPADAAQRRHRPAA